MRGLLTASVLLALTACGEPQTVLAVQTASGAPAPPTASAATEATLAVDGWETSVAAYAGIGSTAPEFSALHPNGDMFTREALRGRWTIVGFDAFDTSMEEERTFLAALNSAVDQDPDLTFLQVFRMPPGVTAPRVTKWPSVADDGKAATAFGVAATPAYLLIGPDLTIEAYRGALSATPEDGIKPVIWGVSEIRKQVAAPG